MFVYQPQDITTGVGQFQIPILQTVLVVKLAMSLGIVMQFDLPLPIYGEWYPYPVALRHVARLD